MINQESKFLYKFHIFNVYIFRSRDFYHTCYALSGLSVSQHQPGGTTTVLGDPSNLLVSFGTITRIQANYHDRSLQIQSLTFVRTR